jgi:hypothetical protein
LTPKLQGPVGYAHVYQKKFVIDSPVMALEHSPKNPGTHAITTEVYDHDFLIFDGHTISEGRTIRFPFNPEPQTPLGDAVEIYGSNIIYKEEIRPKQTVADDLKDYSANAADYHFTVEDTKTKVGVEQSSDSPISSFYLWSIRSTVTPEASIDIASGKTSHWKINDRFFAPPSQP